MKDSKINIAIDTDKHSFIVYAEIDGKVVISSEYEGDKEDEFVENIKEAIEEYGDKMGDK